MSKNLWYSVGQRIRERRKYLLLSQRSLCDRASISLGFLSDIENGKRGIGAETLLRIARATGESLDYYMTGANR